MKKLILFMSTILCLMFGCSEETTQPYNVSEIEFLTVNKHGCNSNSEILKQNGSIIYDWSYENDTLQVKVGYSTLCGGDLLNDVKTTENKIVIYLTRSGDSNARCSCIYKETFNFYAESPKKIEVFIYSKSRETGISTYLEKVVIEI